MQIMESKSYYKIREFSDLREMIRQSVSLYGNLPAFRFREHPDGKVIKRTYREVGTDTDAFGSALLGLGLADEKIAIIGENSYRWAISHLAVVNGVGVSVPLDRLLKPEEILPLLERGKVSAVIFDKSFLDTMIEAAKQMPSIRAFVCMNCSSKDSGLFPGDDRWYLFDSLLSKGRKMLDDGNTDYADRPIDPEQIASLLFTSGTTSMSKGVLLRNRNITQDIIALAKVVKFPVGTRMLSILPLHHTFENTCGLLYGLYMGACICMCDGLRYIQKNMEEYRINLLIGVPALFESFYRKVKDTLKKQDKEELIDKMIRVTRVLRKVKIDLRRIIFGKIHKAFGGKFRIGICGAAPIDPEIIRFFDDIGVHILQGYGLTETSPVVAGCNSKVFVPGTVGHPLAGITIAIDNETDGMEGEILVKGPVVMAGYYEDDEATAAAIDADGWFHTGDVGRVDENGCLSITGRLKSMIVLKSGKKVFPEEIEQLITRYPFIKESMVFADVEPRGDVVINAKFVIDPQYMKREGITEEELAARLEQVVREINLEIPGYKGIRNFVYSFKDLIKTTTQKVKRNNEIAGIQEALDRAKVKFRRITGKNIDLLDSMLEITPLEEIRDEDESESSSDDDKSDHSSDAAAPRKDEDGERGK
ncbi:MAG: AMP-binding protein [Clostridiales bacterium]|nr:AMP-binding protein [Clostridiales bacterium]